MFNRIAGTLGIAGALFWTVALLIEYRYNLFTPGGMLSLFDQGLFLIGQLCYLVCVVGLLRSGLAGDGRASQVAVGIFLLGQALLVIGMIVSLIIGTNEIVLLPIGGLLASLGALLSGIAVLRAGRWQGWTRFGVLALGLYFLLVMVLPAIVADIEPTLTRELVWQLPWLVMGLGLVLHSHEGERQGLYRSKVV